MTEMLYLVVIPELRRILRRVDLPYLVVIPELRSNLWNPGVLALAVLDSRPICDGLE
jgi:hypothetical protein